MANYFMPTFGVAGLYQLSAPFETALLQNVQYKCVALRSFSDITNQGLDTYGLFYQPQGISAEKFAQDAQDGVCIVTLEPDSGDPVNVPNSYIAGAPEIGGVPYQVLILGVELSLIPTNMDLSHIKAKIAADVRDLIGVETTVKTVVASPTKVYPAAQAAALETIRQNLIATSTTDYAKLLDLQARFDRLTIQTQALEQYIIEHHSP